MLLNNLRRLLRTMLPANRLDKIPLGIHEIKIYTVINEVILAGLDIRRRGEVHAIRLAHGLDLLPGPREADQCGVELSEVGFHHRGRVARRVTGDEDGAQGLGRSRFDEVDHVRHFVEFFGADVRAVGEAEVDLGNIIVSI